MHQVRFFGALAVSVVFVQLACGAALQEARFSDSGARWPEIRGPETVNLYLDRAVYPSFEPRPTGRVTLAPGPGDRLRLRLEGDAGVLLEEGFDPGDGDPGDGDTLDFDLDLGNLKPGDYRLTAEILREDRVAAQAGRSFSIQAREAPSPRGSVRLQAMPRGTAPDPWPVTFGVPFPWGALPDTGDLRLVTADGQALPLQASAASRWSRSGSVRWLQIHTLLPAGVDTLDLEYGHGAEPLREPALAQPLAEGFRVSTGTLEADFGPQGLRTLALAGTALSITNDLLGAYLVDQDGVVYHGARDTEAVMELEKNGPLRAVLRHEGWHVADDGRRQGRFIVRYRFWKDQPFLEVDHTFIITAMQDEARYRNIGFHMPWPSQRYAFGTPGVATGAVDARGSYLLQSDDLRYRIVEEGQFLTDGARAEGWVSAGGAAGWLSILVRDFWQLAPKELEVRPRALRIHFWPAHMPEPDSHAAAITAHTLHQHRFVHSGRELDFRIPEEAVELFHAGGGSAQDSRNARLAEPIGLARTHQMLFYLHAAPWDQARVISLNRMFQETPAVYPDPNWVYESNALGPLRPYDPERFPREERLVESTWRHILRQQELDHDYGLFIFGDSHHWWNFERRHPRYDRLWYVTHHGFPRWPWMLYARSGERALFDWARRNAAYVADVAHCHYAPEELWALEWPRHKVPGGIRDYKGYVPWASGGRLCYNLVADALLWHYYLTGNERSRDTARLQGNALLWNGTGGTEAHRPSRQREGSGRATSAIEIYLHTWDNNLLEFIENTMDHWMSRRRDSPPGWLDGWYNFAPALERYIELTGSPQAIALLRDWAAQRAEVILGEDGLQRARRARSAKLQILAYARLHGGNENTGAALRAWIDSKTSPPPWTDDPRRQDMYGTLSSTDRSFVMQWMPYVLEALALDEQALE